MLGEVPRDKLLGLVSVKGSGNSHVAILARAMGIPTIMGVLDMPLNRLDGKDLIVDGYNGELFVSPSERHIHYYRQIVEEEKLLDQGLEKLKDLPCETTDGHKVSLWVNTGLRIDSMLSLDRGAEGVGLYRSEIPFLMLDRFLSLKNRHCLNFLLPIAEWRHWARLKWVVAKQLRFRCRLNCFAHCNKI